MLGFGSWRRTFAGLMVIAWAASASGLAQQPQPASTDSDQAAIRIDAIVTDASGRPIVDLRPTDFELREDGVARPLDAVELRTLPKPGDVVQPIQTESDEEQAAKKPGARVFAFVLDEFHVGAGAAADRVRATVNGFIDQNLRPDDLAVVFKPLDSVTAFRFTRDRAALHGAVDSFTGRKGDLTPHTHFEELYIGRSPAAIVSARRQIVGADLRELTMRLGELQADRGVIVLVSEGFPRESPAASRAMRLPDLDGVVRVASRYHVPIYTVNPSLASEDTGSTDERDRSVATLQWLAAQTGGRTVEAATLGAGIARLKHDFETYYLLSYRPTQVDGRFHAIEIKTKRRDAVVHAAPGYWSVPATTWRSVISSAPALSISRRALRRSPLIDAWVGIVLNADGRAEMVITWEPKVRGLSAPQAVALKAQTTTGKTLFDGRLGQVGSGTMPPDNARFEVAAGRVEIDMTIFDAGGKNIDIDTRDFDVPDLRAQKIGPVLLAPEVVRARTLRDFQSAISNPDAAPSSVRTFARADRLLIRVPAFDPSGTAVQVTAKVLNGWGQPMRDIDPLTTTPREGMPQFALPLAWLVPGEYLIELQATNPNGAVKQRITFRVTG